ncbi:transposase [Rheinheimera sp. SA_1]|nr:transposase [Rheinheimera sp. SA_1]
MGEKSEKQLGGFDERIISLYVRGMSTCDIQAHFEEAYDVEVSPTFISQVTNTVLDKVKIWQQRPLNTVYPIVYLDCLVVRSRDSGATQNIVHQVRHSLRFVGWKERKEVAADLRTIYGASTLQQVEQAMDEFAATWDGKHPGISQSWRNNWSRLSEFFDYPTEIRKVIYTTNAIESLNASLSKVTKTRRSFPNDEAVLKLLYLALHKIAKKWTTPLRDWKPAMNQFIIMYGDRVPP